MAYGTTRCRFVRTEGRSRHRVARPSAGVKTTSGFWVAIATGVLTDEASEAAGVSAPVGYRWFRHAGGVNP